MDDRKPPDSRPNPLVAFAAESRKRREQDRHLHNLARANRGEDPILFGDPLRPSSNRDLNAKITKITADLKEAERKLAETEEALKKEKLDSGSRTGIYRTMFALMAGGYGFRPEMPDALASMPGQLIKDVSELDSTLDIKTARRHVHGAFEQYMKDKSKP